MRTITPENLINLFQFVHIQLKLDYALTHSQVPSLYCIVSPFSLECMKRKHFSVRGLQTYGSATQRSTRYIMLYIMTAALKCQFLSQ
jgi:hypothetical protein